MSVMALAPGRGRPHSFVVSATWVSGLMASHPTFPALVATTPMAGAHTGVFGGGAVAFIGLQCRFGHDFGSRARQALNSASARGRLSYDGFGVAYDPSGSTFSMVPLSS